ncbi:MAG TPA: flagellar basal-body MS-ring/collar protein FliF, partial [Longimicrobiaceae bacterium]|nr:flagellar basal-body MS-ring/collar protein FliF [Longimicrobiaceae bacterium]
MSEHVTTPGLSLPGIVMPAMAQQWVDRIGGPRRAALVGVAIAAVVIILALARWATAPAWVPVYSDLQLEDVGRITERLDEEAIPYRLEGSGTALHVASTDLARARVALAREGMPQAGRPGLEIFDQPAWGMTDFTQRVNYRRALEGELERTIGKMRGVEAVKVHVAMEEATGFRRSGQPSEASVVLRLRSGMSPGPDMVQGIAHLVASSVDGVAADRVMVLDDSGRLLSEPYAADTPSAIASRDLKMRSEVEQYLATKAELMVGQ